MGLLRMDSLLNVAGLVAVLAAAAAWGAATSGEKGSAWTRAEIPARLRRRRLMALAGLLVGMVMLVI
jgi:hypothetical protein